MDYLDIDLKNFYLGTTLPEARFMMMKIDILPEEIIEKYKLRGIVYDGWVYFRIKKGIYLA